LIAKHDADKVNYANIGLMGLSAVLAFKFPFEMFLFAYTVMGPLHYLTEISWLHDRNYYTKGKYDYLFLVALSIAVTLIFLGVLPNAPKGSAAMLTCLAFLAAPIFAFMGGFFARFGALAGAVVVSVLLTPSYYYREIFGMFLPTIVHVFIFTGIFILAGAVKGRSLSGVLSLLVFVGLIGSFFLFHPAAGYQASEYARNSYGFFQDDGSPVGSFVSLNLSLVRDLGLHDFGDPGPSLPQFVSGINEYLYHHPVALSLMAFIAFAYTYHYFNWFSKTSVIRWHLIPKRRLFVILAIWGVSIGLYAYDYVLGLKWLFFLSFAHVLLEFPLNHLTVVQIGKDLKGMMTGTAKPGVSS
jgi:hypothetical protein